MPMEVCMKRLKLAAQWAQTFGKRHAKFLMSFIAALVVVATFAVKDDYREHVRSLGDSIDSAENTFIIRSENERIYDLISHVRHRVDIFHRLEDEGGGASARWDWDPNSREEQAAYDEEQNVVVTLDNIERLAKKLPGPENNERRIRAIRGDMGQFEADWNEFEHLRQSYSGMRIGSSPDTNVLDRLLTEADRVIESTNLIAHEINALGRDVLRDAEVTRAKAERSYARWNLASYLVYAFGALVTLTGVLMGVEGIKSGE